MKCPYCNNKTKNVIDQLHCQSDTHWFVCVKKQPNYWYLQVTGLPIFNQIGLCKRGYYIRGITDNSFILIEKIDIEESKEFLIKKNKLIAFA